MPVCTRPEELRPQLHSSGHRSITPTSSDPFGLRGSAPTPDPSGLGIVGFESLPLDEGVSFIPRTATVEEMRGGKTVRRSSPSNGFTKLFSSWGRRSWDKKKNTGGTTPLASSPAFSSPVLEPDSPTFPLVAGPPPFLTKTGTVSLPHGFPSPPSDTRVGTHLSTQSMVATRALPLTPTFGVSRAATAHSSSLFFPGPQLYTHQSAESMSATHYSSSFASTSGFTDESDSSSEATTVSSPNCSRHSRTTSDFSDLSHPRMWKVKGLGDSIQRKIIVEELEIISCPAPPPAIRDRNSTPVTIPSFMSALFSEPATPPRLKRFSASSQPSPTSPPFDLALEKSFRSRSTSIGIDGACDDLDAESGDADDEVTPVRRVAKQNQFKPNRSSIYKSRIPSIRFEGLSMDAVFAQVEEKMRLEAEMEDYQGHFLAKKAKRRTKMFSPVSGERPTSTRSRSSSTISSSTTGMLSPYLSSFPSQESIQLAEHPSPADARHQPTRQGASRPPRPLDFQAAQIHPETSVPQEGEQTTPTAGSFGSRGSCSPPLAGAFPVQPTTGPARNGLSSSRLDGSFSPPLRSERPTSLREPLSTNLNPSPALSTTSTLRGVDLPEVCVLPPTPTHDSGEWTAEGELSVAVNVEGHTRAPKGVLIEGRRGLRISTRTTGGSRQTKDRRFSSQGRKTDGAPSTPPLSPAWSSSTFSPFLPAAGGGVATLKSALPIVVGLCLERSTSPPAPVYSSPASARMPRFHLVNSPLPRGHDDVPSDAEEALSTLLAQLNSPRTPPAIPLPLPPIPPLSDRSAAFPIIPRTPAPPLTLVQRRSIKRNNSSSTSNRSLLSNSSSGVYDSDDSATRFEDAPLFIDISKRPSAFGHGRNARPSNKFGPSASKAGNFSQGHRKSNTSEDLRQQVLEQSISVIVEEGDGHYDDEREQDSTFSPPRSVSKFVSKKLSTSASVDSTISMSSLASTEGSEYSSSTTWTTDSEGEAFGNEEAVVMTGHRVSCGYDVGMAM